MSQLAYPHEMSEPNDFITIWGLYEIYETNNAGHTDTFDTDVTYENCQGQKPT